MTDEPTSEPSVFVEPVGEDEKLLAELRAAGRLDPVPAELEAAVKASFARYTLDAELAALAYDSTDDDMALAGVRGGEPGRLLTFESPNLVIDVEAAAEGSLRRLVGQLEPAQPARLVVHHGGGAISAVADDLGRFTVSGIEPGPIRLTCEGLGGALAVTTDWVLV